MSVLQDQLPAVTAGTATTVDVGIIPGFGAENFAVGEARVVSHTAQAAQGATNFCTLNFQYSRGGGAPVVLGSINLGTTAIVADVILPFNLGANFERAQLQSGDVLQIAYVHTGTGGACPALGLEIETE